MSDSLRPHVPQPTRFLHPWDFPGMSARVGSFPSPGNLPDPGIKPWSLALQADALPSEPPGEGMVNSSRQKETMLTLEYLLGTRGE